MIKKILFATLMVGCVHVVDITWSGHREEIEDRIGKSIIIEDTSDKDYKKLIVCVSNKVIEIADRNKCPYSTEINFDEQLIECFKTKDKTELSQHMVGCIQEIMFKGF